MTTITRDNNTVVGYKYRPALMRTIGVIPGSVVGEMMGVIIETRRVVLCGGCNIVTDEAYRTSDAIMER